MRLTPDWWQSLQETIRTLTATNLSGPAAYVLDRFVDGHRKADSPRPTTHEIHAVASHKQLEGTPESLEKGHPSSQVTEPSLTMVAGGKQCAPRSTITPNETCSANLYRRIKRRVGRSLKLSHCKRVLVSTRKQAAYKFAGTKSSISSFTSSKTSACVKLF